MTRLELPRQGSNLDSSDPESDVLLDGIHPHGTETGGKSGGWPQDRDHASQPNRLTRLQLPRKGSNLTRLSLKHAVECHSCRRVFCIRDQVSKGGICLTCTRLSKIAGADHPKVAIRLNNLATLLQATNRLDEAEPIMRRL